MLEPQMFTLMYNCAIMLLLNVYYAAINLSYYYVAVMLIFKVYYANIRLLLILILWYSALCTWFVDYSVVVSIPLATSTT